MKIIIVFISVLAVTGCMSPSVQLTDPGKNVRLKFQEPAEGLANYSRSKFLTCRLGANGRVESLNEVACENDMRNEAARVGATVVVLEKIEPFALGSGFDPACNNCVEMKGWAYVKKGKDGDLGEVPSAEAKALSKEVKFDQPQEAASQNPKQIPKSSDDTADQANTFEPFQIEGDVRQKPSDSDRVPASSK